ncbi:MAG TPA: PepSY-like domain-containing protein [Chitinophagaceae bacterium]|jgi:hypothetical protein|nr:PepSY-like domain-containing protein [Chitinophagaceae bacterium]
MAPKKLLLPLLALLFTISAAAQKLRDIPQEVKDAFANQYPNADSVEYKDNLVNIYIHFQMNGEKMVASYTNQGRWKETEKEFNYEELPAEVKDGLAKSKYADWKIRETRMVYRAGEPETFRLKVEKNELARKHLYFNKSGRLLEDPITLK